MKGKVSTKGYKKDSPDKDNDFNIIPSNTITMHDVMHHVLGIDDKGNMKLMQPEHDYVFEGKKVLELPIKNNSMKKTPQIENFQDLLNLMEAGGPIVLQYPIDRMLPVAQEGNQGKIKAVGKPAVAAAEEQKLARQYNFEGIPGETERSTWNKFLEHVGKQYPINSEEAKKLNYGKPEEAAKKFEELYTGFNTQNVEALKQQYARVKSAPTFDKTITEEQFIKARQVTPEMMKNAQKFYGQQTAKDAWFGSETAQSFYPTIKSIEQRYEGKLDSPELQQRMKSAAGKLAPIQIIPYGATAPSDYRGAAVIKGYDTQTGKPIIDYGSTKPFTPEMSSSIYFDPAFEQIKGAFAPYLPQTTNTAPTTTATPTTTVRKLGGSPFTKGTLKSILEGVMKKQFGGSTAPQGLDTNSYIEDKKSTFANYLKKNTVGHMMHEEVMGIMETGGGVYQRGGEVESPFYALPKDVKLNKQGANEEWARLGVKSPYFPENYNPNLYHPQLTNDMVIDIANRPGAFRMDHLDKLNKADRERILIMQNYLNEGAKKKYQKGGEVGESDDDEILPMNIATLPVPEIDLGDEEIRESNLNVPAQNIMKDMLVKFAESQDQMEQKKRTNASAVATGIKGGMDAFSSAMERARATSYQKQAEIDARNKALTTTVAGSRGGTDINDFSFRPNKVGMPTYQLGGNYDMTQDEMVQFMRMGGQIKFID